jgi:hypothetical protein
MAMPTEIPEDMGALILHTAVDSAALAYDVDFGETTAQSGGLADGFRFRFSTKYHTKNMIFRVSFF